MHHKPKTPAPLPIAAKADYDNDVDYFGEKARPCPCGSVELSLIEVHPAEKNYPARVAIECVKCRERGFSTRGLDTCHGQDHAIRRWNWYPPELNPDNKL